MHFCCMFQRRPYYAHQIHDWSPAMTARFDMDEGGLRQVVGQFYARIRKDPALGPIFNDAIQDWPEHLDKLTDFWSSVMLTSGRYKGRPVPAHLKHASRITPDLFQRWLAIWADT